MAKLIISLHLEKMKSAALSLNEVILYALLRSKALAAVKGGREIPCSPFNEGMEPSAQYDMEKQTIEKKLVRTFTVRKTPRHVYKSLAGLDGPLLNTRCRMAAPRQPRSDEEERGGGGGGGISGCTADTPQKPAKQLCFRPPHNRCCPPAVSPPTSAIKAHEPRRCHPTPPHRDGLDYTDKRAGDDNGKGARSSTATQRTVITVVMS